MKAGIESVCRTLVPILGKEVVASDLEELTSAVAEAVADMPPRKMESGPLHTGGFRLNKNLDVTNVRLVLLVEPHQFVIFSDLATPGLGHPTYGRLFTLCWKEAGATFSVDCDFREKPYYGELIFALTDIFRAAPELRKPLGISDPTATAVMRNVDAMIPVVATA